MNSLSDSDRTLPQILHILPLLRRGIGIHHGGLLPILKEVIEILFQEGLIKALFATETFSMGLNMPAKTVVFTNVQKFDGTTSRWISSGEYIQMSGRAGRRGLDDRGVVILMVDEKMEPEIAKAMLRGDPDRLDSAFHLGDNMILNLLRVEGISPEYMLERCFKQYQLSESVPSLEVELAQLVESCALTHVDHEPSVAEYHNLKMQISNYERDMISIVHHPSVCLQFLQPGRLVKVQSGDRNFGWGALVNYSKIAIKHGLSSAQEAKDSPSAFVLDVLLNCVRGSSKVAGRGLARLDSLMPTAKWEIGEIEIVPVLLTTVTAFSQLRIFLPKDLNTKGARVTVQRSLAEVQKRFPNGVVRLDPLEDMHIEDSSFKRLLKVCEGSGCHFHVR